MSSCDPYGKLKYFSESGIAILIGILNFKISKSDNGQTKQNIFWSRTWMYRLIHPSTSASQSATELTLVKPSIIEVISQFFFINLIQNYFSSESLAVGKRTDIICSSGIQSDDRVTWREKTQSAELRLFRIESQNTVCGISQFLLYRIFVSNR